METLTLASLLESITSVIAEGIVWLSDVAQEVGSNPILLLSCVCIPLIGVGIGLFKRIQR